MQTIEASVYGTAELVTVIICVLIVLLIIVLLFYTITWRRMVYKFQKEDTSSSTSVQQSISRQLSDSSRKEVIQIKEKEHVKVAHKA